MKPGSVFEEIVDRAPAIDFVYAGQVQPRRVRADLAQNAGVAAEVVYLMLDWRLGAVMLVVSVGFYFLGAAMPLWLNVALFVVGWIFQFLGHSVYEKKSPAFLRNALHLLVGPLWILNDVVPVVK